MTIRLAGDLTASALKRVAPRIRSVLRVEGTHRLLWELNALRRVDLGGRRALRELQREAYMTRFRSAYVARRPRTRGVALWIAHTTPDEFARPFPTIDQAVDWLQHDRERLDPQGSSAVASPRAAWLLRDYSRRLTLIERAARAAFGELFSRIVGSPQHEIVDEQIRTLGVRGLVSLLQFTGALSKQLQARFGPTNSQFLISLSALMGGCGYCGYGHALAGALSEFKETGRLHPLHPGSLTELYDLEDDEIKRRLDALLSAAAHARLRRHVRSMYELFLGELEAETEEDLLLLSVLETWRWTIECTIIRGVGIEPEDAWPVSPLGADKRLVARYLQARAAARAAGSGRQHGL